MAGNLVKCYIFLKKILTDFESSSNIYIDLKKVNKPRANVKEIKFIKRWMIRQQLEVILISFTYVREITRASCDSWMQKWKWKALKIKKEYPDTTQGHLYFSCWVLDSFN